MFKTILQIIVLIYIILVIYFSYKLQKYNMNGFIIETDNNEVMVQNIKKLNPILLNINYQIRYIPYLTHETYIFKDKDLVDELNIQNGCNINQLNNPEFHFPVQKSVSIIQKNNVTLQRCIHNYNIINVLDGGCFIYLFNPKHKKEIENKENYQIKKWGHKKYIQQGDVIIIPPYWSYIQEVDEKIIQYHIDIDTYFTFIPNFMKGFYLEYTYEPTHSFL